MAKLNVKKCLVALLAIALSISALTLGVFAAEGTSAAKKGLSTNTIVGLVIAGIIVVTVIVVACILAANREKREKFFKFFRGYKSEMKKIVWCPADQLRKSSVVVIVCVVVVAVVVALLDFCLNKGLLGLNSLF